MRYIQLPFICPECGCQGFTPEVTSDEAGALARGELHLRCPACSGFLSIQATEVNVKRELFHRTLKPMFFRWLILDDMLKNGKQQLTSQVSEAIEKEIQDTLSQSQKHTLARKLVKAIEQGIREDVSARDDVEATENVSDILNTIERKPRIHSENSAIAQRLSNTINTVVQETLSATEKATLREILDDIILTWYHDIVNTTLTKWEKTSTISLI